MTSKTEIKEKVLKINNGLSPKSAFFNAFELGAVICKDAHVGAI
jgi:hypothetical protein